MNRKNFKHTWGGNYNDLSWCVNEIFAEVDFYGNDEEREKANRYYTQMKKEIELADMFEKFKKYIVEIVDISYEKRYFDINKDCIWILRTKLNNKPT